MTVFLEALQRYSAESNVRMMERLHAGTSPLTVLEEVLLAIAGETPAERARGCMGVNATTELAHRDPEVVSLLRSAGIVCEAALAGMVREAKRRGEVSPSLDERTAGRFLLTTLQGLRVSAKAGASPESLRDVAAFAIAGLEVA